MKRVSRKNESPLEIGGERRLAIELLVEDLLTRPSTWGTVLATMGRLVPADDRPAVVYRRGEGGWLVSFKNTYNDGMGGRAWGLVTRVDADIDGEVATWAFRA